MVEFGAHEVAPFALPVPPGSTFEGVRSGCVALTAGAEQGGKTSSASLRTSTSRVWDEIGLRVWDVEIFEGIDSKINGARKPVTEERCRAVFQMLQRRLDMVKPDGSLWRQRASYVGVEPDYLGARVILFYEGDVTGLSLRKLLVNLDVHEVAPFALPTAPGRSALSAVVPVDISGRCNRRRPPS